MNRMDGPTQTSGCVFLCRPRRCRYSLWSRRQSDDLITVHVCAYQATHTNHNASIILLGGLKEVIHPLTPHSWQNYVSVLHFRQRYASDSNERGAVCIANEGGCGWPDGKAILPKRQIYG